MVITVTFARAMQVAIDQIVDVITVGHGFMTALSAMLVTSFMTFAGMLRCAGSRVSATIGDTMTIYVIAVHVMHMTIMQIIYVTIMLDGFMTTICTMLMIVCFMFGSATHFSILHIFLTDY